VQWRSEQRDVAAVALPHRQSVDYCQLWRWHPELVFQAIGAGSQSKRRRGWGGGVHRLIARWWCGEMARRAVGATGRWGQRGGARGEAEEGEGWGSRRWRRCGDDSGGRKSS
jgi:hypothetical protein